MSIKSDRLLAVKILKELTSEKGSLSTLLAGLATNHPGANLSLIREYTFGVCRWYQQLDFYTTRLLEKPLRKKDADVHCLILLGLYQLFHMRTPDHAAINETVAVARLLKKPWALNLVNAVLRQAQRDRGILETAAGAIPNARYSHPAWLIELFSHDWPDHFETLLAGNNQQAPMVLRVNQYQCTRNDYLALMADSNIAAVTGCNATNAVILDVAMDVGKLPGFADGLVSVQDEASQLASELLNPAKGARVLDACAAPGGKTCALLEHAGGKLDLLALDNSEARLVRVRENLDRLALEAEIVCADATDTAAWWDGNPFDSILLDAPCSGTGVIRRHPDIKLLRHEDDIDRLGGLQQQLLAALWPCLKPGGQLLYSTCSVLRAENEQQVSRFLTVTTDAAALPLSHAGALPCSVGMQFLPGMAGTDGFYYALLEKT